MRTLLLLQLAACAAGPPVDVGDPVRPDGEIARPESDTPEPADTDATQPEVLAPPEVALLPAAPAYDDDLVCTIANGSRDIVYAITWFRDGEEWLGAATTTTWPGDTVPHLAQAGGEQWRCTVEARRERLSSSAGSEAVTVAPPVPMVVMPPGDFLAQLTLHTTLTRPFLVSIYEIRNREFAQVMGYLPVAEGPDAWLIESADEPAVGNFVQLLEYTNRVSERDGLAPCFTCTGSGDDLWCDLPADIYACDGYRLPTEAEWEYAARSAGTMDDPLPAGGRFNNVDWEQNGYQYYDVPVYGTNAPPDSTIGTQCVYAYAHTSRWEDVGGRLPSPMGLYDLCGNAVEYTLDKHGENPRSGIDPWRRPGGDVSVMVRGGSWGTPEYAISLFRRQSMGMGGTPGVGLRLVRTLRNPPPGGAP